MRKASLLALPVAVPEPPEARGLAVNYVLCFRLRQAEGMPVLVIDAFDATCRTLMRRVFCWQGNFTTHSFDPCQQAWKWQEAMVDKLLCGSWWDDKQPRPLCDAQSEAAARAFLGDGWSDTTFNWIKDPLLANVQRWQEGIRSDQLYARHQRALMPTRQKMAAVPELPEGVEQWVADDLLLNSRYLLYQYTGKKKQTAHCSHCGAYVEAEGLRHLQWATCPACGSRAQAMAEGKVSRYGFTDRISFCVIQRYEGTEIVARHFGVERRYQHDEVLHRLTFEDTCSESIRSIWHLKGDRMDSEDFQVGVYKLNTRNGRGWIPYTDAPYPPHRIYPHGLADELRGTWAQYTGLDAFARGRWLVRLDGYLSYWAKHAEMELIVKGGLYRLAAEIAEMERYRYGVPRVNAETLKRHARELRAHKGGYYALLAFESLDKGGLRQDAQEVIRFTDRCTDYNQIPRLIQFAPLRRVNDYLRQRKNRDVRELLDYWNMERALGANMTEKRVLFPPNLRKAHNEATTAYNQRKAEIMVKGFKKQARKAAEKYSFAALGFLIVVPGSAEDLAEEGKALDHCVRSYAEDMADGKTAIVFVRRAGQPEVPFYTMEIRDGAIIQLRGKHNCAPTPEVARFEKEFCAACHIAPRAA